MPGPLEHLPSTASVVGRFDPRWRLAALVLAGVGVLMLRALPAAALALLLAALLALLARLPRRWSGQRLGLLLLALTPFLALLAWSDVAAAVVLLCKTLALALLMLVLLATAPLPVTLRAAQALHVPNLLVQLALLTYRYVFVLAGELTRLRLALRVRGYRNRPTVHCYRTVGHVAGTLLVRGYEQAERVEHAMRARGFDGRFRTLQDWRTRPADVLAFLVIVGLAAGLVVGDRLLVS